MATETPAQSPAAGEQTATDPSPAHSPTALARRRRLVWALSLLSGLLLWLAYFPADCGWLAWVALVPWLWTLRACDGSVLPASFAAGLLFGLLAVQWVRLAHVSMYLAWCGLAMLLALHWWLFAWIVRWLTQGHAWPLPWVAPLAWTAWEFTRARIDIGFSWYFLGHTQHHLLPYLGLVPLTGAYGLSALVMLVNAVLVEWLVRGKLRGHTGSASHALSLRALFWWSLVSIALLLVNPLLAWHWQKEFPCIGRFRVLIAQPNEPQEIRNLPSEERWQEFLANFRALVVELRAHLQQAGPVDLVVWPETSMPYDWVRLYRVASADGSRSPTGSHLPPSMDSWDQSAVTLPGPDLPWQNFTSEEYARVRDEETYTLAAIQELSRLIPVPQLQGVNTRLYFLAGSPPPPPKEGSAVESGPNSPSAASRYCLLRHNSALLVDGAGHVRDRYDKIYCIPFGEYIPLRQIFPWMEWLSPYNQDYSILPGSEAKVLRLEANHGVGFGVLICYEDTVPHFPRQFFAQTAPDFFVNLSNDGWFHGSEEHEQHLAIARFRAAETRRSLLRSVNMGISAVVDGDGSILALPKATWRASKACATVFSADLPRYAGLTIYVRWGDWFCWSCVAAIGLCALLTGGQRFVLARRRAHVCLPGQSKAPGSG